MVVGASCVPRRSASSAAFEWRVLVEAMQLRRSRRGNESAVKEWRRARELTGVVDEAWMMWSGCGGGQRGSPGGLLSALRGCDSWGLGFETGQAASAVRYTEVTCPDTRP
jgi:hypothetical protein